MDTIYIEGRRDNILAEEHWEYIQGILIAHAVPATEISRISFHYKTAFTHGYKHGVEDTTRDAFT